MVTRGVCALKRPYVRKKPRSTAGDGAGGGEELLGAGADANVFCEVFPSEGAGGAGGTPFVHAPLETPFETQGKRGEQGKPHSKSRAPFEAQG